MPECTRECPGPGVGQIIKYINNVYSPVRVWVTPHAHCWLVSPWLGEVVGASAITGNGVSLGTAATSSWSHRDSHSVLRRSSVGVRRRSCVVDLQYLSITYIFVLAVGKSKRRVNPRSDARDMRVASRDY